MENINQLIKKVKSLPNCRVQEPTELPLIDKNKHMLPG
ncbi:SMI1/KNR4 family protein, partial [Bacillus thuringiensis]|nr:SMI1/KNR4 family protein [Bacillus thuringiensis]